MDAPRPRLNRVALILLGLFGAAMAVALWWRAAGLDPAQVSSLTCGMILPTRTWRMQVTPFGQSARCRILPFSSDDALAEFTMTPSEFDELLARVAAEHRHHTLTSFLEKFNPTPSQTTLRPKLGAWVVVEKTDGTQVGLSCRPETSRFIEQLCPPSAWVHPVDAP
ncbi:MAG: hypothetical protein KC910_15725 [Candidatus Eremiobacteraeota bacterium]|nr:hypothetical protein [Candidatus Eremiobacteraeota bacterium]